MRIWQKKQNRGHRSCLAFLVICLIGSGNYLTAQVADHPYATLKDRIMIRYTSATATQLLREIDKQTAYDFIFQEEEFNKINVSGFQFGDITLGKALLYLRKEAGLDFSVNNKTIAVRKRIQSAAPVQKTGRIAGKVIDEEDGQPVAGASIRIGNTGKSTDIDGAFNILISGGNYTAQISAVGYGTKDVTEIEVKENETYPLQVTLKKEKGSLSAVTVVASARKESVASLYTQQKNAAGISDGISAEQIRRTPDKNIGEVLKRVSGMTTMDNKYMVVRGLSERYNSASVNGQIMPSTELNRKNFSFDLIPANIVDQVVVNKSITPDMNAEFGGGNVNVDTKAIPTENFFNFSAGISVNDLTTGKDFLSQQLSSREYLGLASKSRYLLGKLNWKNTKEIMENTEWNGQYGNTSAYKLKDPTRISNNWQPYIRKAHPSQNYQLSLGRVIHLKENNQLGFLASLSYRNTLQTQRVGLDRNGFRDDAEFPIIDNDKSYGFTTNTGAIIGVGYATKKHKLSLQSMYLGLLDQQLIIGTGADLNRNEKAMGYNDLTTYTRLLQNQLKGEHAIGKHGIKIKWLGSYTLMDRQRPDNHQMVAAINPDGVFPSNEFTIKGGLSQGISAGALRWWTRAYEKTYNWDIQVAAPFQFSIWNTTFKNTFKTGYSGWQKDRLFYVFNTGSGITSDLFTPIEDAFSPNDPTFTFNISRFSDDFHKTANLHAGFFMLDSRIAKRFRLVWGLRGEYYNMNKVNQALEELEIAINRDRGQELGFYDLSYLKNRELNFNLFPSANFTFSLKATMNLRLAYSKSIIRPDLREMAYMKEYDFELGGEYESNVVKSSILHNYDLRYEWYPGPGEVISATLFSKKIRYPMEIVEFNTNNSYVLKNNKEANNKGIEVEIRKSLSFFNIPLLRNFTLYGNFTYLDAHVTPMDVNLNVLDPNNPNVIIGVEKTAKVQKRPQTGASNFMFNAGLFYDKRAISVSLVYNQVSYRIYRSANIYATSLFEQPPSSLDAQIAVRLPKQHLEIRLNASNLLNAYSLRYINRYKGNNGESYSSPSNDIHKDPTRKEMSFDESTDVINYKASPGRTYGLTLTYKL